VYADWGWIMKEWLTFWHLNCIDNGAWVIALHHHQQHQQLWLSASSAPTTNVPTHLSSSCFVVVITTQQPFYGPLSGTTRVSQYQKKHSSTHTYPDHQPFFISFLHLLRSIASYFVQFTCLTVFARPFWFTSWSGTPYFILHTSLHPAIVFFSQHMPIPSQPVML